ncbi:hypothetical protein [Mycolicibacterium fortuitum]|uniref:hypothetical protein n=1 Tax=Mycolicibacterium fortuitum TaxID=1766 RepID=UPI003B0086C8
MPLQIGDSFAEYRVQRLLGSGGMGEVYLVEHPRLPRFDALKVLRQEVCGDASFQARFIREADMAARLRHPHTSQYTTAANTTANCGSRWTTSTAPTPPS